ncbi:hypothetical protein BBUCA112A_KI0036 (plasmid) [Borreliella burgdorferi CA-11.2A]|nr:hypothetical protein BBUCA112A_KI0036 [Borreliella burgdorferi CA-11.2A]
MHKENSIYDGLGSSKVSVCSICHFKKKTLVLFANKLARFLILFTIGGF